MSPFTLVRRTPAVALVLAVVVLAHSPAAQAQCDPYTSSTPVAVPAGSRDRCGDGRATSRVLSCERRCSGGCGHPRRCSVECERQDEPCDGRDLRGQTCRSLGFAGGVLACRRGCSGFDLARCEPCFPGARVSCVKAPSLPRRDASSPRIAARADDVGLVWMIYPARSGPDVFFVALDRDLRPAGAPRPVGSSNLVPSIAATPAGYLIASYDGTSALVHRVIPGQAPALAWRLPGTYQYIDLAVSPDGDVVLTALDGSGQYRAQLLDEHGEPRPMPATPLHATGWFGRVLIAPLAAGEVRTERAVPVAVRDGDHLVAWVRAPAGLCGSGSCEARVEILRDDTRVGGFGFSNHADGAGLTVALPGGATVRLTQTGGHFDDEYTPGAAHSWRPLHARGPMRVPAPEGVRVFADRGVGEAAFAQLGDDVIGVAVFAPTPEASDEGGALHRLLLARVRP